MAPSRTLWSSQDVETSEAFAHWADVVCDAFVGVTLRSGSSASFTGRIEHAALDGIGFVTLSASPQRVVRTSRMIARDDEDVLLANIQLRGRARLEQNGQVAVVGPGAMAFVDSTRPYALDFAGDFSQLVVKVPGNRLSRRSLTGATAVALDASGPGGVVAAFLARLERMLDSDPAAAAVLLPHAVELLDTALSWAGGTGRGEAPSAAVRERVHGFVRRHATEPGLDAAAVAAGCGVSRRTMYRALAAEGDSLAELIRSARVSHARRLVLAQPARPLAAVARACGFAGEGQLYRSFRAVTGMTPGAYRSRLGEQA